MALNFVGFPIGSAIAGAVVPISIPLVLLAAVTCETLGAVFAFVGVPGEDALA